MTAPVLIACSHGTRSAAGRAVVEGLRAAVRSARPGLDVAAAQVDVHDPFLADVIAEVCGSGREAVVVPLLLSSGYHVRVDIAEALEKGAGRAVATPALGPGGAVADVLVERLEQALGGPVAEFDGSIVLAAAGSSDAQARADVDTAVADLSRRVGRPVTAGFLSAQEPGIAEAVAGLPRVAVASYLLAPGVFSERLAALGAEVVAEPLGVHPGLVDLVLRRYDEGCRTGFGATTLSSS